MNLSQEQQQAIINKIKASTYFKKAPTSSNLLQYLYEATQKNTDITESVIHIEFFGAKNIENKTPKVRVNIYNLRRKINQYYEDEGASDPWIITIKKGQYQVLFEKRKTKDSFLKKLTFSRLLPWALLAITAIAFIVYATPPKTPIIWKPFLDKKTPNQLYIGDLFGIVGPTALHHYGWTRDYNINNYNDYYQFMRENPEYDTQYSASPFTLVRGTAITSTQNFQRFFQERKHSLTIRYATKTSTNEIKEGNAIYIGNIWNNKQFIRLFNDANPECLLDRGYLYLNKKDKNQKSYLLKSPQTSIEYAIVSRYQSFGNTHHLIFSSQHGIGVSATAEFFTSADSVKAFTEKYLGDKKNFTAIFKVKGQDRTNISLEIDTVMAF